MAKTTFDLNIPLTQSTKPLYAGVGVTDLVVEVVRDYVTEAQKLVADVQKSVAGFDYQPRALRQQATQVVSTGVDTLGKDAQARRKAVEGRVVELQKLVDANLATAGDTYADLVKRGESLVGRIRRQESTKTTVSSARTTTAKAKTTKTQASKAAASTTATAKASAKKATAKKSPARKSAKATKTSASKTASSAARAVVDAGQKVGD